MTEKPWPTEVGGEELYRLKQDIHDFVDAYPIEPLSLRMGYGDEGELIGVELIGRGKTLKVDEILSSQIVELAFDGRLYQFASVTRGEVSGSFITELEKKKDGLGYQTRGVVALTQDEDFAAGYLGPDGEGEVTRPVLDRFRTILVRAALGKI